MTACNQSMLALLAATSPIALAATPALAQAQSAAPATTQTPPAPRAAPSLPAGPGSLNSAEDLNDEEIIVTGARERGAVVGDVKPLQQFDAGDVRALGVSSVNDLLTELGPQVQSASGRPPVLLLEGHRISSPQEIGSLPSEAIQRVDVLPEEVGLRYGYGSDQRVVNIVLRQRFRAFNAEINARVPTAGAGKGGNAELGYLSIRNGKRFNTSVEVRPQERILETDRGLNGVDSAFRTLMPSDTQLTINSTYHHPLGQRLAGTINGEITTDQQDSLIGRILPSQTIPIPASSPYAPGGVATQFAPTSSLVGPLERSSNRFTGHGSFGLTRDHARGQITLTGTYDHSYTRSISDRSFNLQAYQTAVAAGSPNANPANEISQLYLPTADVTRSYSDNASLDLLYNTSLFMLPGGDVSLTTHLSGSTSTFRSYRVRDMIATPSRVHRDIGGASATLNIPIAGAGSPLADAIGRLSTNINVDWNHYSDAGSVHSIAVGVNWQPHKDVSVTGNFTDRQNVPTANQLGDAPVVTQNVPIFDYIRGETANVTTISGGSANLAKGKTQSFRIGVSVNPLRDPQLNFQFDLSHNRTTGGISALPGITLDTQTAFASRFTRLPLDPNDPNDDDQTIGRLSQVDLRPINITEQKNTQFRWGFNFNLQLKTPQSEIRAYEEVIRKRIQERINSGQLPPDVAARLTQALQSGQLGNLARQFGGQGGQQGQGARPGGQVGAPNAAQGGQAQPGQAQPGQAPQSGQAQPQASQGQTQGGQAQQPGQGGPNIVVLGNPNGAPGGGPQGGNFVFQGGPGGGGPPGGFRGGPGGGGFPGGGFGGGGFGGGGFGGGGGQGGAPRGGRLNFSVFHTWVLDQTVQLAPTLPVIDLLNGGTLGGGAGPSQHQIQVQGGYTQGGFGFRTFINWNSATHSNGSSASSDLRFGALARTNFRVFLNFQQMPKTVDRIPFLRGSRLQFGIDNLFDARQKVTDRNGVTPYAYQGAFLDRQGRTFSIGFRKLFF
jgi:iron complex outermembrane recepter protein